MSLIIERTQRIKKVLSHVKKDMIEEHMRNARQNDSLLRFDLDKNQIEIAFERNVIQAMKNKALSKNFYSSISQTISAYLKEDHTQGTIKLDAGFGFAHWRKILEAS